MYYKERKKSLSEPFPVRKRDSDPIALTAPKGTRNKKEILGELYQKGTNVNC